MFRFLFTLLLLVGLSFGGKSDSLRILALSAKVDSLSLVLKDAQLAGAYAEKTLEATKSANQNVVIQFLGFVAGVLGILVISFAVMGFIIYQRSEKEREFIAGQVSDLITPGLNAQFEEQRTGLRDFDSRITAFSTSYYEYTRGSEARTTLLQTEINGLREKFKISDETKASLDKLIGRVTEIEVDTFIEKHIEKMEKIDTEILNKEYSWALKKIGEGITLNAEDKKYKFVFKDYCKRISDIVIASKKINASTKSALESYYIFFTDIEVRDLKEKIDALPVKEKKGLLLSDLGVPTEEGLI